MLSAILKAIEGLTSEDALVTTCSWTSSASSTAVMAKYSRWKTHLVCYCNSSFLALVLPPTSPNKFEKVYSVCCTFWEEG